MGVPATTTRMPTNVQSNVQSDIYFDVETIDLEVETHFGTHVFSSHASEVPLPNRLSSSSQMPTSMMRQTSLHESVKGSLLEDAQHAIA